jgi:hypothetical protein
MKQEPDLFVLCVQLGFMRLSAYPFMQSIHFQSLINSLVSMHPIASHIGLNWGMVSFESHRNTASNEGIHHVPHETIRQETSQSQHTPSP